MLRALERHEMPEFLGAALGFYLLFRIPLFPAALLTGVAVFGILAILARLARSIEVDLTDRDRTEKHI